MRTTRFYVIIREFDSLHNLQLREYFRCSGSTSSYNTTNNLATATIFPESDFPSAYAYLEEIQEKIPEAEIKEILVVEDY